MGAPAAGEAEEATRAGLARQARKLRVGIQLAQALDQGGGQGPIVGVGAQVA